MKSFIVCCDFRGDDEAASEAGAILNQYLGARIKPETWVITADTTVEKLYSELRDIYGYVFIAEIQGGCRMNQPQSIISWFRKNQNMIF